MGHTTTLHSLTGNGTLAADWHPRTRSEKSKQMLIDTFAYNVDQKGINSFSMETMCFNQITDECHLNHNVPEGFIDVKGEAVMSS